MIPKALAGKQSGSVEFSVPTKEFETPNGEIVQVLDCDYGFRSGASRLYEDRYGEVPGSIFELVSMIALKPINGVTISHPHSSDVPHVLHSHKAWHFSVFTPAAVQHVPHYRPERIFLMNGKTCAACL